MHTSGTAHATGSGADEHPTLETLAAFLDGKLPDAERTRVMKHLAACKACFSLFADTARTLRDLEPAGGKVLRFPFLARPEVRRALPLAAAAVLAVAVGLVAYDRLWAAPRMDVEGLAADLPNKPELSGWIWPGATRGTGDGEMQPVQAREFQLGARLLDFQLSVEAGNAEKAAEAARRIMNVLDESAGYPEETRRFREAWMALDAKRRAPSAYRGLVAEVTPAVEEGFGPLFTDLGKWTAAGRLSAKAGDPAFFERRANRRFLQLLLADPARLDPKGEPLELDEQVRQELEKVAASWDERDYDAIVAALESVLRFYETSTEDF